VTGDRKYQDWGWEMWTAIEKHCKTKSGYSGIKDVTLQDLSKLEWNDSTQSFWMAETLKYFYLLFQVSGLLRNVTS
jgi:mannosyl-oligosaccharide alpha-1,2-mannosidase